VYSFLFNLINKNSITILFRELLQDILMLLRNTNNPQVEYITRTIVKWAKENMVTIDESPY